MISKPKILKFYHTLRKSWHFDILGEIGPIKVGPNLDRPWPKLLNAKFSSKYDKIQIFLC